jgi:hypothetical protein
VLAVVVPNKPVIEKWRILENIQVSARSNFYPNIIRRTTNIPIKFLGKFSAISKKEEQKQR